MKKSLAGLALGLIVLALATPSFGQSQPRVNQTSATREAAIHECSVRASKYQNAGEETHQLGVLRPSAAPTDQGASTDGRQTASAADQFDIVSPWSPSERVYWTCMVEHGQHLFD
jgi:hypothetical protein